MQQFENSRDETSQTVYDKNIPLSILNTYCNLHAANLNVSAKILIIISLHFTIRLGCMPRCATQV